jgi:DNA polymerase-4/protein ImuB
MAIACLLVPHLALACELAEQPHLARERVVLANVGRTHVVDCTPEAARYGVRPGQPLRAAMALCPGLVVLEERPARAARAAETLAEAMSDVSPVIEEASAGVIYADLGGLEGLYPHPSLVDRAIFDAVPAALQPRLGVAEARFTAYSAARCTDPGAALHIESDEAVAFLASKPASWLPLEPEAIERLRLFGIETMAAFVALPVHALEAQFGHAGRRAWLAARGEDPTALRARPFARERVVEHVQSEPPLVSREAVTLTCEQLLIRALRHPRAAHRFVRCVRLRATTEDDRLWERTQVLREPTGDRERLWHAIRPLLEYAEYPGPIADLELELGGLTAESGRQPSLLDAERTRRREQMDEMVRHLKVRFGQSPMARMVEVEPWSRIPERRWALMDYDP